MRSALPNALCGRVIRQGCYRNAVVNGFFVFYGFRLTHVTLLALHGVTSQETPHTDTPLCKMRPALV